MDSNKQITGDSIKSTWSVLDKRKHINQLFTALRESSHPKEIVPTQSWIVYWITHSLALLEQRPLLDEVAEDVITFIKECAHPDGGYGGGPGQIAHMATTFASVNALITINTEQAFESIDRPSIIKFLQRMKQQDGSFAMHDDGEVDSRATYCALSVLRCLNIRDDLLLEDTADWILSCQTYEGGFGSIPGSEAHGGYTFCCVASLCLLNQLRRANLQNLLRWLAHKQMSDDGGFCGRSNKLVDSCYSYWQGAIFPLLHPYLDLENDNNGLLDNWIFDASSLQDYILNQCQASKGLLRDKPDIPPDFYHTCYALSGLSISQHQPDGNIVDIGARQVNIVDTIHPLFNLTIMNVNVCFDYFKSRPLEYRRINGDSAESKLTRK